MAASKQLIISEQHGTPSQGTAGDGQVDCGCFSAKEQLWKSERQFLEHCSHERERLRGVARLLTCADRGAQKQLKAYRGYIPFSVQAAGTLSSFSYYPMPGLGILGSNGARRPLHKSVIS